MPGSSTTYAEDARPATPHWGICGRLLSRFNGWILTPTAIPFALAAITLLVFVPALQNGFVEWDDQVNLLQNVTYRGLGWTQLRWMFTTTLMGHYIPVTWLTFGLDYTLWGMNPLGYHLTNNLLHATNAALFYLVALRLIGRATTLTGTALRSSSALAALFFALHPLRAESVAWATERRDVLAGFFFLLTIFMYLGAAQAEGARRRRLVAGSLACYILAMLSKSIVMTLPLILILLDIYPLRRLSLQRDTWRSAPTRAVLREKIPFLAVGLAGAITAYWAVASHHYLTDLTTFGWLGRITLVTYSLWFYVEKTALPLSLSAVHELPAAVNPIELRFALTWAAVVGMSATLLALRRRWPAGLAVWVYYGIVVGPVSGLVHAGHQLAHDRYSYLSCLGWALLFGAAVGSVVRATATGVVRASLMRGVGVMATAWIVSLAALTWHQAQVWHDSETLWRFAVEADPNCSICQSGLGTALYRRGLFGLAKDKYELALALRPGRIDVHRSLGATLHRLGDDKAAISHLNMALASRPDDLGSLTNMAVILQDQKSYAAALHYLERVIRIDPDYVPGLVNLGDALLESGKAQAALPYLLRARELRPDEPVVHGNLTRAYLALSQYELARKEYETLTVLDVRLAQKIKATAFRAGS